MVTTTTTTMADSVENCLLLLSQTGVTRSKESETEVAAIVGVAEPRGGGTEGAIDDVARPQASHTEAAIDDVTPRDDDGDGSANVNPTSDSDNVEFTPPGESTTPSGGRDGFDSDKTFAINNGGQSNYTGNDVYTTTHGAVVMVGGWNEGGGNSGVTSMPHETRCMEFFDGSYTGDTDIFQTYLNVTTNACNQYVSKCSGLCAGDVRCILYNDCCIDAIGEYLHINATLLNDFSSLHNPKLLFKGRMKKETNYEAHVFISEHSGCVGNRNTRQTYWMINKCSEDSNSQTDIIDKCENETQFSLSLIPVYYTDDGGVSFTYQNVFCAICHGRDALDVATWTAHYTCNDNVIIDAGTELQTIEDECEIIYQYPLDDYRKQLRACVLDTVTYTTIADESGSAVLPTGTEPDITYSDNLKSICRVYIYPVHFNGTTYRNAHCAAYFTYMRQGTSNHNYTYFETDSQMCGALNKDEEDGNLERGGPDLKSLFDFDPVSGYSTRRRCELSETCDVSEIADCALDVCRTLYCPDGTAAQHGYCVPASTPAEVAYTAHLPIDTELGPRGVMYQLEYMSLVEDKIPDEQLNAMVVDVFRNLEYVFTVDRVAIDVFESSLNGVVTVDYSINVVVTHRHDKHPLEVELSLTNRRSQTDLLKNLQFEDMDLRTLYMRNYISVSRLTCPMGNMSMEGNRQLNFDTLAVFFIKTDTFASVKDVRWAVTVVDASRGIVATPIELAITCFSVDKNNSSQPNLNCSMVAYGKHEFRIIDNVLYINKSELVYTEGEFIESDDKAFVCDNKIRQTNKRVFRFFTYSNSHKLITTITSAFSAIAFLIIIGIHIIVPKLRNGHGLNLTALSTTMLLIQIMMMSDMEIGGPVCTVFGVCLHFLLLKMFVWMNIIGFDMARLFHTNYATARGNVMNKFIKYVIFSFGISFAIVLFCISLDYTDVSFRPKYGAKDVCYITNPTAVAAFVVAPVACSILLNFIMFAVSVYSIQSAKKATKRVRNSNNRAYCLVYFKMTVILGFTWILAIVAALAKVEVMWYMHTVLNGLQGVSIFVCFILNARVLKAVSEKSKLYKESTTFTSRVSSTESKVCSIMKDMNSSGKQTTVSDMSTT